MAVQQHVLNWLYSVLTSEYRDVNRAYSDVAQALAQYPSLSPRTDVHSMLLFDEQLLAQGRLTDDGAATASSNGSSALLVRLTGTIPVPFRGTTYRFPISLWVPHGYPQEAPLVYVTPTEHMMVRPGQHVDPQGQVYHPYLAGWAGFWDKSSILDFLAILRDVFAKEPPVVARQPGGPPPPPLTQQLQTSLPPPVPPLPPDLAPRSPSQVQHYSPEAAARPPPPPPKPGMQADLRQPHVQRSPRSTGPPPVPPLPPKAGRPMSQYTPEDPRLHHEQHGRPGPSRYETAPPLPPQAPQSPPAPPRPFHPPVQQQQSPPAGAQYQRPPPPPSNFSPGPPQPSYLPATGPRRSLSPRRQDFTPLPPQSWQQQQLPIQQAPSQPKSPVPDIMDADDLTLSIPTSTTTTAAAPPIPPNPEKDALLHQLASTLFTLRQQARDQNASSLVGLQAQRQAMLLASNRLQAESAQLTQLSNLLTSNTAILQDSLRKADTVIESSSRLPEPNIDELLVAPTVVGNQLYDLVAEERALADAIFVLGRAVERGRIAPQTFARLTRSLAREWYLKKALVRKIGVGMGLSKGVGH